MYSVTVTRGVAVTATGEATIVDTRFQFETAATAAPEGQRTYDFPDEVTESATVRAADARDLQLRRRPAARDDRVEVFRLAGLDAAIAAYRLAPEPARLDPLVDERPCRCQRPQPRPCRGLPAHPRIATAFGSSSRAGWPAGWYVVQQTDGSKPIQTVLQVTDVAGYLAVSGTRTIVWANDVATGRPIAGAIATSEGARFARTDARGLAIGTTPKSLLPATGTSCDRPCGPVVVVRSPDGRQILLPVSSGFDKLDGYGGTYWWSEADERTWTCSTRIAAATGPATPSTSGDIARDRAAGTVPATVTIRLVSDLADGGSSTAPRGQDREATRPMRPARSAALCL